MKKFLHFVLLMLFVTNKAQNWNVFNESYRYNYKHDTATIISNVLFQDSVKQVGNDTVYFLNRVVTECIGPCPGSPFTSTVSTSPAIVTNMPQFLQRKINKYSNGTVMLSDPFKLVIKPHATLGQTWLFDSIANVSATCVATATQIIFNQTDSVKIMMVGTQDSLVLSKLFGIIKFPDLYNKGRYHRLKGIENRFSYDQTALFGQKVPNAWDFYNYQVGDVICEKLNIDIRNGPSYECSKSQVGIVSKTVTATGYVYGINVHGTVKYTQSGSPNCDGPIQFNTSVLTYTNMNSVNLPENYMYPRMAFYAEPIPTLKGVTQPYGKVGYPNVVFLVKGTDGLMYKAMGKYECFGKTYVPEGKYLSLSSVGGNPNVLNAA